jgi:hypothetical protein
MNRLALFALAVALVACGRPATPSDPLPALIIQPGDIPARYQVFAARYPPQLYPGMPKFDAAYYYEIALASDKRNEVGHITVVRFTGNTATEVAYGVIRESALLTDELTEPLGFGEWGRRTSVAGTSEGWADVVFQRCNTIVHISLEPEDRETITEYARRLHERLQPVICG